MKKLAVISCLALTIVLAGCKDPYGACAKASDAIAKSITAGQKTVLSLQQAGTISAQEGLNIENYLEFANIADEGFATCIGIAHQNGNKPGTYTACAQALNAQLNTPANLALVKVSSSKQGEEDVTVIVNGLDTAVQAIITGLKGA